MAMNKRMSDQYIQSRYPVFIILSIALLIGVIIGSIAGMLLFKADSDSLSFIVDSNLSISGSDAGFWDVFSTSILNDIVLLIIIFILGFTPYGFIAALLICAYKGFTVGFVCGFIFAKSGLAGILGNAFVILPGAAAASFAVIFVCGAAAYISNYIYRTKASSSRRKIAAENAGRYISEFLISMTIASCAAFINSLCLAIFGGLL
jgi:stage II sporulation protein M